MSRKKLNPYDVASVLIEKEWPVVKLADYFGVSKRTIREKLQQCLYELQAEITDLEGEEQAIEEALSRRSNRWKIERRKSK